MSWLRRAGVLVAAGVAIVTTLGIVVMGIGPVPAAQAQDRGTPADGDPVLTLLDQPTTVGPTDAFTAFLSLQGAPTATEFAVDLYDAAAPGDPIGAVPEADPEVTFGPVAIAAPDAADPSAPRSIGFAIELYTEGLANPDPRWGYQIDEPGVYPVRVRLRNDEGDLPTVLMTTLIRTPGPAEVAAPAQATVLVDVDRPPPDEASARAEADTADAELLTDLLPILDTLDAVPDLPAAFSITPDTLARIAGDPSAAADLQRLRSALAAEDRVVVDAPYVDIDASSLVGAGLADELTRQRDLGRRTLSDLIEEPVVGTWRLRHRVDEATLSELRDRGIFRTLLPSDALGRPASTQPVDLTAGTGTVRATTVTNTLEVGTAAEQDPVLDAHRILARLALQADGDGAAAIVSVEPGVATQTSLTIILGALGSGDPSFAAAPLDDALDVPRPPQRDQFAAPVDVPLGAYPEVLTASNAALRSYASMVVDRPELITPYERTLAISAAADLELDERQADAASVASALEEPFSAITIPVKDKVTLGAADATFPLPVRSSLDYPVTVVIELQSNDRLEFPNDRIEAQLVDARTTVPIKVSARGVGDSPVRITVRTPDDGRILAEGQYTIRSTAISGVGVVLTVGAIAVLALWWGRHLWRNHRTKKL